MNIDPSAVMSDLQWLSLAVSHDPTRYAISRVVVVDGNAIATDGHRLHLVKATALPEGFAIRAAELEIVLTLKQKLGLISDLEVTRERTVWKFAGGSAEGTLNFQVPIDPFVDYARVMPKEEDGAEMKTADLRRVSLKHNDGQDICAIKGGHFNARYIAEALRGAPKTIQVYGAAGEYNAVLFAWENRRAVVMPRRQPAAK